MSDRLLNALAGPTRIYSPNPDAPQYVGMQPPVEPPPPSMGSRLMNALAGLPQRAWGMLPPEARKAYTSGFNALVDMTTPAAVRDYTTAAQDTARSATQGDGWGTATNALATVNAALGAIPVAGLGIRAAQKGARDVGRVAGEGAQNFIRAYHGSPHDFDRFDLSKIGTGEGAQAYGHGLYFAENEGVAKGYRDNLTKQNAQLRANYYGAPAPDGSLDAIAQSALLRDGDPTNAKFVASNWKLPDGVTRELVNARIEELAAQYPKPAGRMYEVAIHADPAKFLDWDKPLSQQPMEIRNLVDTVSQGGMKGRLITPESTGADLYHAMKSPDAARRFGYQNWSTKGPAEYLRDTDIPGIKYLDQGSRAAGDGSRNYVVFDDKLIEILRKYGLLPFAGAAGYAAMPGQDQPQGGLF